MSANVWCLFGMLVFLQMNGIFSESTEQKSSELEELQTILKQKFAENIPSNKKYDDFDFEAGFDMLTANEINPIDSDFDAVQIFPNLSADKINEYKGFLLAIKNASSAEDKQVNTLKVWKFFLENMPKEFLAEFCGNIITFAQTTKKAIEPSPTNNI